MHLWSPSSSLKEYRLRWLTDQSLVFRAKWWQAGLLYGEPESLLVMRLQIQREGRVGGTGPLP